MKLKIVFFYLLILTSLLCKSTVGFSQKVNTPITIEGVMVKGKDLKDILDKYELITVTLDVSSSPARLKFFGKLSQSDSEEITTVVPQIPANTYTIAGPESFNLTIYQSVGRARHFTLPSTEMSKQFYVTAHKQMFTNTGDGIRDWYLQLAVRKQPYLSSERVVKANPIPPAQPGFLKSAELL